ncbi:MAG: DMT family transporter [Lachnospiraceae bacterium]|nr:DMT family transporter [Lachnospiraceae bacterium]MCQ4774940.1 DMT family transporter [Lacrimispora saccharolytica]MDD7434854.1 DMT family transporter [Lachnospiraceae bacterium]MDY3341644.1 DMT family transporter [Lachnospiraceae bacterium]RGD63893.1 DMT family transporter [Lachnospiraceae bacterium OF09-6]
MYGVMIALASGALMSIQGVFNTDVTKQTSLWVSAAFVQFTALLVCLAAWLLYDRTSFWSLWEIQDKYVLLGGAIGALITATVIRSMNALGPAKAAMLIVIAQLAVAWMIELLGVFGVEKQEFSMRKLLGLLIAVAGVITFEL